MKIKELKFDENDLDSGIQAISFVTNPAIEKDFIFFSDDFLKVGKGIKTPLTDTQKLLDPTYGWKYWEMKTRNNETPTIPTSHEFCKKHVDGVYSVDDIHNWESQFGTTDGWINNSKGEGLYCQNFKGMSESNFNLDQQLFNCRHFLTPCRDVKKIKKAGYKLSSDKPSVQTFSMDFSISNAEQRQIKGVCMIADLLIYRRDPVTQEEYHVYFSRDTIKKLKERYGFNREITIQHEENITGNAILLNSWLYPEEKDDNCGADFKFGWCLEYKILNETLWNKIKEKGIKGFSVEALLPTT